MARKTIEQMIDDLIKVEGSFSDHPMDRGGPTMYGVTQAVARANGYQGQMRDMPLAIAQNIYRKKYFIEPGFDSVYMLSPAIAEELFDTGVNMGTSIPGPWLQRLLNVFNDAKTDLVVDGKIGPATIVALRLFLNKRGSEGEAVMVRGLNCLQGCRYVELTESRAKNRSFIYGWLKNRVTT